jgi:hypothetical protein
MIRTTILVSLLAMSSPNAFAQIERARAPAANSDQPPPEPPFDKPTEETPAETPSDDALTPAETQPSANSVMPPEASSEVIAPPTDEGLVQKEEDANDPTKTHYIHHPQTKKGLTRITNDGTYIYKVKATPQHQAGGFSVGSLGSPAIQNPSTHETYSEIYGESPTTTILVNYEYQFYQHLGKLGFKAGTGLAYAQGHGELTVTQQVSLEEFSIFILPNNAGVIYRMQYWDRQPVIPYGEAGADYFTFVETRNDGKPARYGGALAAHVAGGVALSLNWLDRVNMSRLDQEYGINSVYLTGEYRHIIGLNSSYDFTSNIVSGGFLFEF